MVDLKNKRSKVKASMSVISRISP